MVKSWLPRVLWVIVLVAAGCRQPDGPVPQPTAEEQNEIGDVSRDLLSVAGGDAQAVQDFRDDLVNLGPSERGARMVPEMAARFGRALSGRKLTREQALALGQQLYLTFAATSLSPRQIQKIQDDVREILTATGAGPDVIDPITRQIEAAQALVTTAEKRWWHVR